MSACDCTCYCFACEWYHAEEAGYVSFLHHMFTYQLVFQYDCVSPVEVCLPSIRRCCCKAMLSKRSTVGHIHNLLSKKKPGVRGVSLGKSQEHNWLPFVQKLSVHGFPLSNQRLFILRTRSNYQGPGFPLSKNYLCMILVRLAQI